MGVAAVRQASPFALVTASQPDARAVNGNGAEPVGEGAELDLKVEASKGDAWEWQRVPLTADENAEVDEILKR